MQYTAVYGCQIWFSLQKSGKLTEEVQGSHNKTEKKQTLYKYLSSIVTWLSSFSFVFVSVRVCVYRWMLTVVYCHLFSLSSCLPVPSWFCLSVFSDTLPWYRSWVHSMLHFLLVRKWDPAVRERGEGIRRKKQWKKAEIFTPVALCQWVEVREGQWNWILMHFCDIIQFRQ